MPSTLAACLLIRVVCEHTSPLVYMYSPDKQAFQDCHLCRTQLDAMAIHCGDGLRRQSVCYASYGYMGDLLALSESLRKRLPQILARLLGAALVSGFRGQSKYSSQLL